MLEFLFVFVFCIILLHWRPWEEFQWAENKPTSEQTGKVSGKISKEKCLGRLGPGREKGLEIVTIGGMGPGSWVPPCRQISQSSTWPILWMSNGADDMSALKLIPNNERDASFLEISFAALFSDGFPFA